MPTPLFTTKHAPVGAWASITFGADGRGASVDQATAKTAGDLLIALQRDGTTAAFPFVDKAADYPDWKMIAADAIVRNLTPCVDEFVAAEAGITLRVFTPHAALPNPKRSGNLQYSTAPGVLAELIIDNTQSDAPATAFVGWNQKSGGHLRALDWSSKTLCGVGHAGAWLLAATSVKGEVFTIQSREFARDFAAGTTVIEGTSPSGGIAIKVPPRSQKTVNLVFAFFDGGGATQGVPARYLYTAYFQRIETVANFILQNHQKIRESCSSLDGRVAAACGDPAKVAVFAQGVRAYESRTQLADAEGVPYFTVLDEGGYRNALDRAVDHLPWELFRNPWVIRNIFDLGTTSYSYQDKVRFVGEGDAGQEREGGLTFTHDCGLDSCYSSAGASAYERAGRTGVGSFMSTESLLNGIYLLTSYALLADDTPWSKTRLPFARELLTSMENRDHWDPEKRNGILKAESNKSDEGAEVTAYAGMGGALEKVPGNLYLAVKTFCANLMLTTYFQGNNDLHSADYSYAFAQKTANALIAAFDAETGVLPANVLDRGSLGERMIAALEPLAVPTYLGLTSTLAEYFPELFAVLKRHAMACLEGGCVDSVTGGLRLISSSDRVIPAKVVSVLYVLEVLFGVDVRGQYPGLWGGVSREGEEAISAALFVKQVQVREAVVEVQA